MSLITCCPACGTMFKVVPDQLKISEGWVRCGHCAEVFDASAHLLEGLPIESVPAPPAPPVAQAPVQPPGTAYPPFVLQRPDSEAPAAAPDPVWDAPAPLPAPQEDDDDDQPGPALADVSFVRQARRKAFWRRPLVRALLALLGLGLAALLAAQLALQERDRLAALQPQLRPWLEQACGRLHCSIGAPRQIDAVLIDSSTFSKLRGDAYRLNLTLKNQSAIGIAMPSVELTLTDAQDQPVLRRVLSPSDLGAGSGLLAAASDWSGTLALSVAPNANAGRIAGYRLLAFYP